MTSYGASMNYELMTGTARHFHKQVRDSIEIILVMLLHLQSKQERKAAEEKPSIRPRVSGYKLYA